MVLVDVPKDVQARSQRGEARGKRLAADVFIRDRQVEDVVRRSMCKSAEEQRSDVGCGPEMETADRMSVLGNAATSSGEGEGSRCMSARGVWAIEERTLGLLSAIIVERPIVEIRRPLRW